MEDGWGWYAKRVSKISIKYTTCSKILINFMTANLNSSLLITDLCFLSTNWEYVIGLG